MNRFPLDVFSDGSRAVKVNSTRIPANQSTGLIPWLPTKPNDEFIFYLTSYLPLEGIMEIPFIPRNWNYDYTMSNVTFEQTTTIPIHNLAALLPSTAPLINDVAVIIENNFTIAVRFERGNENATSTLQPQNITTTNSINSGSKGFYRIPPANNTNSYFIRTVGNPLRIPSDIASFAAGHLYIIEVQPNGTLFVKEQNPLTISRFD